MAIPDAWFAKSITIELTKYGKEILDFTKNHSVGSEYIDYFVDIKNEKKLIKIFNSKKKYIQSPYKKKFEESYKNNLFKALKNNSI